MKIIKTQKVLSGRVVDPEFVGRPGMSDLVDAIEIQNWSHLFKCPVLVLHDKEIMEFYYNSRLSKGGSLDIVFNSQRVHLDEKILGTIMKIYVSPTSDFIIEISKVGKLNKTRVSKKFMMGTF